LRVDVGVCSVANAKQRTSVGVAKIAVFTKRKKINS
jgi:hypothetical protein